MSGVLVEPVSQPTADVWPVTTATAQRAVDALNTLVGAGQGQWLVDINISYNNGTVIWVVALSRKGFPTVYANNGDWIIAASDGTYSVVKGADINSQYKPKWDATTTAPTVTSTGGQITVTCPVPDSADEDWAYSLTVTDNTTSATVDVTPTVSVSDGTVTLTAEVTPGDEYVTTVTADYAGLSATSLPTDTITAQE